MNYNSFLQLIPLTLPFEIGPEYRMDPAFQSYTAKVFFSSLPQVKSNFPDGENSSKTMAIV
jgi:hypothetical protein